MTLVEEPLGSVELLRVAEVFVIDEAADVAVVGTNHRLPPQPWITVRALPGCKHELVLLYPGSGEKGERVSNGSQLELLGM